jgi:serine protease Do
MALSPIDPITQVRLLAVNSHRFIVAGIFGIAVALIQPQISWSYTAEDISRIAKEVTVIIDGKELGSGVVVGHQGYEYFVLTNWHVLKNTDTYTIGTRDGAKHRIQPGSIKRIGNLDLAVCTFSSPKLYKVAEIGNSDTIAEGSPLYVTGAPANVRGIETRSLLVVSGQLVGYDSPKQNGYTLIYNNNTSPGMSGGSVLDKNGNLVGIHGQGSQDARENKTGFNLGIPINLFVNSSTQLGIKYTLSYPKADRSAPSITPSLNRGRPTVIDGSENTTGACVGERC